MAHHTGSSLSLVTRVEVCAGVYLRVKDQGVQLRWHIIMTCPIQVLGSQYV